MNDFVNPNQRGVALPPGKKDLIDMLPKPGKWYEALKIHLPVESFEQIEAYLVRLTQSTAKFRSVGILSTNHQERLAVSHEADHFRLMVNVQPRNAAKEECVLDFFSKMGIAPISTKTCDLPVMEARILFFPLPLDVPKAANLIRELLLEVLGLAEDEGLHFGYYEKNTA